MSKMTDSIKIAAHCTRCKAPIVLTQDPECPTLVVEKWLRVIVCNRCGKYLEAYRRIDEAIALIGRQLMLGLKSSSYGEIRAAASEKLTALTHEFERIVTKRYNTTDSWSYDFVELLMDKPDKTHVALRMEESNHRRARERADKEAADAKAQELAIHD